MAVGRLAWRTATGALAWEIWGRRRWNFLWHALALLAGMACACCKARVASELLGMVVTVIAMSCFVGSYLCLLTWFGYIEAEAGQLRISYPARLLLKPVSTLQLALVPMAFGGAALATVLLLWDKLVLEPLGHAGPLAPVWLGAISLSFFWWTQALAWGLPFQMLGRALVILMMSVVHLLVALLPLSPVPVAPAWRWLILAALLGSAVPVAFTGLKWTRRETGGGPSRWSLFWAALLPGRARLRRPGFGSVFRAQFWLEWRINGLVLPGVVAGIGLMIIPVLYLVQAPQERNDFGLIVVNLMLAVPLVLSGVMSTALARFGPLQPAGAFPLYIAVRPITNGGLLLAKLAVGLASSVLAWLIAVAAGGFWLAVLGPGKIFRNVRVHAPGGMGAILIGCLPVMLLLILVTWKNLLGGLAAALTGRQWVITVFNLWRALFYTGLLALILAAKDYADFRAVLLHWLPWLLAACLASKIALAAVAFAGGLRRNALTVAAIGWIAGAWVAGGLFLAAYSGLVCGALNRLELWLWIAPTGFLILPLADAAIAPLSLAWNRHR